MKEVVGFNFKKIFRKPNENLRLNDATICALCVKVKHNLVNTVQRYVKNATPVKRCDTSQKHVEATLNQIQVSTKNRIPFAKKETILQSKHLQHRRWECFIL